MIAFKLSGLRNSSPPHGSSRTQKLTKSFVLGFLQPTGRSQPILILWLPPHRPTNRLPAPSYLTRFRGTCFAARRLPLQLIISRWQSREAIDRNLDHDLDKNRRLFLYTPFEHSENIADQQRAVELIGGLDDGELLHYAVAHRDIIARYGRFPHRNVILGRTSTPE